MKRSIEELVGDRNVVYLPFNPTELNTKKNLLIGNSTEQSKQLLNLVIDKYS